MKYIIYELIVIDHLHGSKNEGYGRTSTIDRLVLEEVDEIGVESKHPTAESAMAEISLNKDKLKMRKLTVMPIISINWDGEIY
jgi:hypothetical protein